MGKEPGVTKITSSGKREKKKAVIMEDKKEGAANVQQRAVMVVNAI